MAGTTPKSSPRAPPTHWQCSNCATLVPIEFRVCGMCGYPPCGPLGGATGSSAGAGGGHAPAPAAAAVVSPPAEPSTPSECLREPLGARADLTSKEAAPTASSTTPGHAGAGGRVAKKAKRRHRSRGVDTEATQRRERIRHPNNVIESLRQGIHDLEGRALLDPPVPSRTRKPATSSGCGPRWTRKPNRPSRSGGRIGSPSASRSSARCTVAPHFPSARG